MAELCSFCRELVFYRDYPFVHRFESKLGALYRRAKELECPFCAAFLESLLIQDSNANSGSEITFRMERVLRDYATLHIELSSHPHKSRWIIAYAEVMLTSTSEELERADCD